MDNKATAKFEISARYARDLADTYWVLFKAAEKEDLGGQSWDDTVNTWFVPVVMVLKRIADKERVPFTSRLKWARDRLQGVIDETEKKEQEADDVDR